MGKLKEGASGAAKPTHRLGWIGTGRMGSALVDRLLERGCDVTVYNRTRSRTEPLRAKGARVVESPSKLSDRDIVLTTVSGSDDFAEVVTGANGLLSDGTRVPRMLIDVSTVSAEVSETVRAQASRRGMALLAAPVSGNPKVAQAGRLSVVVSGPREAYEEALPILELLGRQVTYVGDGDRARLVKICHNLLLGIVAQSLAEITVLAERGGISRADFLDFINGSVLGSTFSRYKTPALVNLDFTPTFTGHLLLKDFELGLDAGKAMKVPLPVAERAHQVVGSLIHAGLGDLDFAALIELEARAAGMTLKPENRQVADGLEPDQAQGHA
jgi:3-hydroxyisobutyrate dehydrogenase-like beta-hydroxyacid dehydrogenase